MSKMITRRNFFKRASVIGASAMAGPLLSSLPVRAADGKSTVVLAKDTQCLNGDTPVQARVNEMVDYAIMNLTGIPEKGKAYEALFPATVTAATTIAIKKNYRSGYQPTTDAVVTALKDGLSSMLGGSFPAGNVKDYSGGRAVSTSSQRFTLKQWSWQSRTYVDRDFAIADEFTKEDWLINVPVAWGHNLAGTTLSLKNHLGSVRGENGAGISNLHGFFDETHPSLAVLNSQPYFRDKQVLVLADAICCRSDGGPGGSPNVVCHTVIAAQDRVAADYQGTMLLADNGLSTERKNKALEYLALCGQAKWGLGTADPANMDVINITPPWSTGVTVPRSIPQPLKHTVQVQAGPAFTLATFHFNRPVSGKVTLEIFDLEGKRVWGSSRFSGRSITWSGRNLNNKPVPTGVYTYCLRNGRQAVKAKIHLVR